MRVGTEMSQAEKVEIHMPFATTEEAWRVSSAKCALAS